MSVASFLEPSVVSERRYWADAVIKLDQLIAASEIELTPVDLNQAYAARTAFRGCEKGVAWHD